MKSLVPCFAKRHAAPEQIKSANSLTIPQRRLQVDSVQTW